MRAYIVSCLLLILSCSRIFIDRSTKLEDAGQGIYSSVSLVGTLSDWNPSNTNNFMVHIGHNRYAKVLTLKPGEYELKFAMNRSWDINLGGAVDNLQQGGENIKIFINEIADYKFILDVIENRANVIKAERDRFVAIIDAKDIGFINEEFILDGSKSIFPPKEKVSYLWTQDKDDKFKFDFSKIDNQSEKLVLIPKEAGNYHFYLNLAGKATTDFKFKIVPGVQLISDKIKNMFLTDNPDIYEYTIKSPKTEIFKFKFRLNNNNDSIYGNEFVTTNSFIGGEIEGKTVLQGKYIFIPIRKNLFYTFRYNINTKSYNVREEKLTEFTYIPSEDDRLPLDLKIMSVDIPGTFNNWNGDLTPMFEIEKGIYKAYVKLLDGIYYYKFRINKNIYLEDLSADPFYRVDDGMGKDEYNSGILVGKLGDMYKEPEKNDINIEPIAHDNKQENYFNPVSETEAEVRLRVLADDIETAYIFYTTDGDNKLRKVKMWKEYQKFGFDYYKSLIYYSNNGKKIFYYFKVIDGDSAYYIGKTIAKKKLSIGSYFSITPKPKLKVPEWARYAIWYEIFPERFRNGNPQNDPEYNDWGKEYFKDKKNKFTCNKWTDDWEKYEPWEIEANDRNKYSRHYGGDFQGIIEKLLYLQELGITAIWFNPIFESDSNHKYDAIDYRHIDDNFGFKGDLQNLNETEDPKTWVWTKSDKLFLEFIKQAHKLGIKVIIDGVFNHSSDEFWAFERAINEGPNSKYANWFHFRSWDAWVKGEPFLVNRTKVKYEGWYGFSSMPKFMHSNPEVKEHIFNITKRWLDPDGDPETDDGVDGFRLDVPMEVPKEFWLEWQALVKKTKPDAFTVGEIWHVAPDWVRGDIFDSLMNYEWLKIAIRFFVNKSKRISVSQFDTQLKNLRLSYPVQVNQILQNLTGSHDTDRILSRFINPDLEFDQNNRIGDGYDDSRPWEKDPLAIDKLKLFYIHLMTYIGAPMIYYGDEVAMYGADDPYCRKPMLWDDLKYENGDKPNMELFNFVKRLIEIRKSSKAFSIGDFETLITDDRNNIYAYKRSFLDESFIVVLNNDSIDHILKLDVEPSLKNVKEMITHKEIPVNNGIVNLNLPRKSGLILELPKSL